MSDVELRHGTLIVLTERLTANLLCQIVVIPNLQVVLHSQYVDTSLHLGGFSKLRGDDEPALFVECGSLSKEMNTFQELLFRGVEIGHPAELSLELGPGLHGVNANVVAAQAGDENVQPKIRLDELQEARRNFESTLFIDPSRMITPEQCKDLPPALVETPTDRPDLLLLCHFIPL